MLITRQASTCSDYSTETPGAVTTRQHPHTRVCLRVFLCVCLRVCLRVCVCVCVFAIKKPCDSTTGVLYTKKKKTLL